MQTYLIFKSVLMTFALVVAFGIFFIKIRRLVQIMRSVEGESSFKLDRIPQRIKILITDIMGQSNVRRKFLPGLAHTLIFYGFLAVQPHSLELMIKGVFYHFNIEKFIPGFYGVYLFVADILAVFVLVGLGYALYRRLVIKPKYLTKGADALFIILFTSVIIITFHFINGFHLVISSSKNIMDASRFFTVSAVFANIFHLDSLSITGKYIGYEIAYWIHMFTIMGFLIYIPGSKHLHLLAAVPNVFLKPLEKFKAISKTDIEDEDAENFGLGKINELNWKNVLDLYSCTECGRCEEQCPANLTDKPLSPKHIISDVKHDLFDQSGSLLAKSHDSIKPIVRDDSPITSDVLWSCTTCRACEDICPVNIGHLDIIFEARKHQVLMEANFPLEMQETFDNLKNQYNPWGFSNDTRTDWCKGMDIPLMAEKPDAEVLYFVGCAGSFDDRGKKIARAIANILKKADVSFAILGNEEKCNGDIARRAGNEYLAQMLIQENVETLNQYKPKKILAGCPHCYNMLKNEYPQFGATYEVVHHTEFIFNLFQQGRLTTTQKDPEEIVFHDSCYLGRWNGIYDAPRKLLSCIFQKNKIKEMKRSKDKGLCCGAGGARMFMEETTGKRINHERAKEVSAMHTKTVAAACPFCITMLQDGIADIGGDAEVKDIAELIDDIF